AIRGADPPGGGPRGRRGGGPQPGRCRRRRGGGAGELLGAATRPGGQDDRAAAGEAVGDGQADLTAATEDHDDLATGLGAGRRRGGGGHGASLPRDLRRPPSARCGRLTAMAHTLAELSDEAHEFLAEYHLGTLSTVRRDGSPHVVAVGFTVDVGGGLARVITRRGSQKARNAERG